MKIVIDGSKAINEKAGIARYTWQLCSILPKIASKDNFLYFFNFVRKSTDKINLIKDLVKDKKNVKYKIYPLPGQLKEKIFTSSFSLTNLLLKGNDLYHATEFLSFDIGLKIPQILTVHDLTMVKFPNHRPEESHKHSKMIEKACSKATHIIATSEATKNDIIKYFNIDNRKISVTYQGTSNIFKKILNKNKINKIIDKYGLKTPYLLFVGTIEPRKNIINLIKAFEKIAKNIPSYNLYLVGRKGWNSDGIYDYYEKSKYKNRIEFLDYVSDEDLVYLYNGAKLFCYPSIYEGFGLPILEAMKCGVPVITSNISSMPEVGGKAVIYVDPKDHNDLAQKMQKTLKDEKVLEKLSWDSLKQSNKFSWDKCACQTYKIYKKVLDYEKQK